ncbi:MAG: lysine exporter LysO family protein [Candidatus Cloacimonadota bacterium]|nr:MAG: lysine exporter LysO family protein [Candidatus Cloacimonadota bacterium]
MKNSFILVFIFFVGVMGGLFSILPEFVIHLEIEIYMLYLLMFFVGIVIGSDISALWKIISSINIKIVFVPLSVIVGTLLGVGLISFILPELALKESLVVGAGFGYYSLSSIIISQTSGERLGTIALLSNVLREVITLLTIPLLVKHFGKLAPIAAGGATSMDTTLPLIAKFVGREYATISIFSGMVLTILVPFLVTFLARF